MSTNVNEAVSALHSIAPEVIALSEADFNEFAEMIERPLPSTEKLEALASAPSPFLRREVSTEDIIFLAHNSAKAPRFPSASSV